MHLKILFLFYYLVVPPIVHSYYISFIESLILGYDNNSLLKHEADFAYSRMTM